MNIEHSFGMLQPGRSFSSDDYRFGFNGKENDNEIKGTGDQQDYGQGQVNGEAIYDCMDE